MTVILATESTDEDAIAKARDEFENLVAPLQLARIGPFRDLEFLMTFAVDDREFICELGDWQRSHIDDITRRLAKLQKEVTNAISTFSACARVIDSLLRQHPDWTWKDAVQHLAEHGVLEPEEEALHS